jgi:hypothetical protein
VPDRIEELEDFTCPELTKQPLPATEVRRRGTRLRRRNLALATAGTIAACALIGTPLAVIAADTQEDSPVVAEEPVAPTVEWLKTIPSDFPLGDGMSPTPETDPATEGEQVGEVVLEAIDVCGKRAWSYDSTQVSDVLGAVWSDGIEGGEQRTLAVYDSERRAQVALDAIAARVTGCSDLPPGDPVIVPFALESDAGDDSLAYFDQYADRDGPTGQGNAYFVVRVGNALLLDKTFFRGAGDTATAQQTANLLSTRSTSVIEQMCIFSGTGC